MLLVIFFFFFFFFFFFLSFLTAWCPLGRARPKLAQEGSRGPSRYVSRGRVRLA
jgi:hypothetical protein